MPYPTSRDKHAARAWDKAMYGVRTTESFTTLSDDADYMEDELGLEKTLIRAMDALPKLGEGKPVRLTKRHVRALNVANGDASVSELRGYRVREGTKRLRDCFARCFSGSV